LKHSGDPTLNDGDMEIEVNDEGQEPIVAPGQVNVKWCWWGNVWSADGFCNLVTWVIGIEDAPLYSTTPRSSCMNYPGWPFDYTKYFTAPTQQGSYRIFGIFCPVYTKDQAIQYYLDHPELRFQVGTLIVTSAEPSPPVAIFTKSPEGSVAGGQNVHFDASESYDPDGTIVDYLWDFDDGTVSHGILADHSWGVVGIYTVTLIVTDNDGLTNWASKVVTVATPGPRYRCTGSPDYLCVEDQSGPFTSLETCQAACIAPRYRCTGPPDYLCVEDPSGPYTSLETCEAVCIPQQRYRCTGAPDYLCVEDPSGQYTSLAECQKACKSGDGDNFWGVLLIGLGVFGTALGFYWWWKK